jgi:outer membrane protein assembly factor BamE (lipoprotein component of BamABCDE complex)
MKKVLFIALVLASCTTIKEQRGAELRDSKTSQITASSTKADVLNLLGSPSTRSSYGSDVWYYIHSDKKRVLIGDDDVYKQQIIAITFDANGVVQNVEQFDQDDAKQFSFSGDRTPTAGNELGVLEQILGNVGKFNSDSVGSGRGAGTGGRSGPKP